MPNFDELASRKAELIRKTLDGSVFGASTTADPIDALTVATGTAPNTLITLNELPDGWDDFGHLTDDGMQFSRDVSNSEITSLGSTTPTRTDIISDTSTLTFTCQETKLLTLGLATGADLANLTPDPETGELSIAKPTRPKSRHWRILSLAVDEGEGGEIYIARFLPRAKVTSYAEQTFGGEDAISWGVTFTGETDSDLGYSERWLMAGPGWANLLVEMGFPPLAG